MGEDTVVALAYGVTYGLIVWFAIRLQLRYRRLARTDSAKRDLATRD
jgi:hypothetical protein